MEKKVGTFLLFILGCMLLFALAAEGILRWQGHHPFYPYPFTIQSIEPEPYLQLNDQYGFFYHSGTYTITYQNGYHFTATHGSNATRITRPKVADSLLVNKPLWHIYGCSFTYGQGVADSLTFPWQLQAALPDANVVNYGVGAYGILHALLQLQAHIEQGSKPDVAVVTYAAFHDERSTFIRKFRKNLVSSSGRMKDIRFPYARLGKSGELKKGLKKYRYRSLTLINYSAFANYLDNGINEWEARKVKPNAVSRKIIKIIADMCKQHQIKLIVAGISNDERTGEVIEWCQGEGWNAVSIGVDLKKPENNLLPYDNHPSGIAHRQYAEKLLTFIAQQEVSTYE